MENTRLLPEKIIINKVNPTHAAITGVKENVREISILNNSAILDTFKLSNLGLYEAKSPDDSSVMRWHLRQLPIVPWVVQKWLLIDVCQISDEIYSWKMTIRSEFWAPILPQWKIRTSTDTLWLEHEDGKNALWIIEVPDYKNHIEKNYDEAMLSVVNNTELDNYLLQSNSFRLASWAAFLTRHNETELSIWDIFQWYYKVPNDMQFFDVDDKYNRIVSPYLIEEMAAQIWVLAFSERLWKAADQNLEIIESWSTMTFNSSTCRFTWNKLALGSEFRLTWKIKEMSKRAASFEYVWFDLDWTEIIRWEICGNIVPLKLLKRMFK